MKRRFKLTRVTCTKCGGSGIIPLSAELQEAFALIQKQPVTAKVLLAKTGFPATHTAMNQRLERLVRVGLVCRRRQQNNIVYSAV